MTSDASARSRCFHPGGRFVEFRKEEIEQSIPERFEKIAREFRERPAIKSKNYSLTYDELNRVRQSRGPSDYRTARHEAGTRRAVMEHDAPVIAGILGALKAGKFYAPLDPSLPHSRIEYILGDLRAGYILTNNKNSPIGPIVGRERASIDQHRRAGAISLIPIPASQFHRTIFAGSSTPRVQPEAPKG